MKKLYILLLAGLFSFQLQAQQLVEKTFATSKDQPIELSFDFPTVKISTWKKSEVSVKASVNINDSKGNNHFELLSKEIDGKLFIRDSILDRKHIEPEYYVESNGVKKRFDSKKDMEEYKELHKNEKISSYNSTSIDVALEIFVPENANVSLLSKFGLVEVKNYTGPLNVSTQFGKIDVALNEAKVGHLKLTNEFGKIYSNFDVQPVSQETNKRFYTSLSAKPGNGPDCTLASKFGNIYLRKEK